MLEKFREQVSNFFLEFFNKKYKEGSVRLGQVFLRYLDNAEYRYNQVKTLTTGSTPRSICGDDSIYVEINLSYGGKTIETSSIEKILKISKYQNVLIFGTGGTGKTFLMRYLFLNTAEKNRNGRKYVPILLDLRQVCNQSPGNISIINLIYNCMEDFDVDLPRSLFEYSLRLGRYIFLLDGLDEVKSDILHETIDEIQKFCSKYPDNPCIITSRPIPSMPNMALETFTSAEIMPLNKKQAVLLASKIWPDDKKTKVFCNQLEENFFDDPKYTSFAENPLLLSMMYITFMRNNSLPDHLADFYQKTYDALYNIHDANKDNGFFKREFKSGELSESDFKLFFSRFCFETYFNEYYELSDVNIKHYLRVSAHKTGLFNVSIDNYLIDLQMIVCMIIKEGATYRFAHRSFQTFFAAYYLSLLTDEEQKSLFRLLLAENDFSQCKDFLDLLFQLQPKRFVSNILKETLKKLVNEAQECDESQEIYFSSVLIKGYLPGDFGLNRENEYLPSTLPKDIYERNVIRIFKQYVATNYFTIRDQNSDQIKEFICKMGIDDNSKEGTLFFTKINIVGKLYSLVNQKLSNDEKEQFYAAICQYEQLSETIDAIQKWLSINDSKAQTNQLLRLVSKL